ncbi:hypothetical protein BT96DRAFT_1010702 [Gymnopus androsaceus JB14]|uniref:Uncharacterized protein n=1 Tax=Gymnopus androsaceus JB14 TaxID=1447944 RepID=A0A6A4GAG3_9AGAR|nr:hypothetical protein BT96DRAFT_1010702 [Gymnopus androsaceus JB14]
MSASLTATADDSSETTADTDSDTTTDADNIPASSLTTPLVASAFSMISCVRNCEKNSAGGNKMIVGYATSVAIAAVVGAVGFGMAIVL